MFVNQEKAEKAVKYEDDSDSNGNWTPWNSSK